MKSVRGHRYLSKRESVFYFRRAVPEDARHAFGGRSQVWQSLDTSDLSVARSRLQPLVDEFERYVAKARGEVAPAMIASAGRIPSVREIEKAVRVAFLERLDRVRPFDVHNPIERSAAKERLEALRAFIAATEGARGVNQFTAPQDVLWQAEAICEDEGWPTDNRSPHWRHLVDFVARSQIEAASRELQALEGRPGTVVDAAFASEEFLRDEKVVSSKSVQPVALTGLFEKYVKERQPAPATVKSFGSKVRAFVVFLGHDDATRITKSDVVRWKEHLLERGSKLGEPLNPRSVRETFLPAVRATLELGVSNGDLPQNVASGVKVLGSKKGKRLRSASFTDAEAELILRATLVDYGGRLSPESKLARRWVPWICAYSGARVNEITQLRAEDIAQIDGVWTIRITPEAGGTKDGNARLVALHPHLIEQGMLAAFKGKRGHLFVDPLRRRGGSEQNPQTKKVGEHLARWVRGLGIERGVQPNHAWRHRFKTVARNCRMSDEVRDYIQGHALRTEGEKYGEFSPLVLLREISLMPTYQVPE